MAIYLLGLRDAASDAAAAASAAVPPASKLDQEISGFLLRTPRPSSSDVAAFLQLYNDADRDDAARALIAAGVDQKAVSAALTWLDAAGTWNWKTISGGLAVASAAASGYHGYRRNNSIFWGAMWFILGGVFPVFVPVIALAQGFGKRKAA